jgi:AbrB family looped-hinge helix DNA binding protein
MRRTIVNARGQVTIPAKFREQFGIEKGTRIIWKEEQGQLVLTPINERLLDKCMGFLKPSRKGTSVFEASLQERRHERRLERN